MLKRVYKGRQYVFQGEKVAVVLNLSSTRYDPTVVYRVERTKEILKVPRQTFLEGATEVEGLAFSRNHVLSG